VMLAQAIALENQHIKNPKIILVTDRIDLDTQLTETFQKCGKYIENAVTGQRLTELLESKSDAIITTVINKFEAAVKKAKQPFTSPDIFVLVDEGHRTQYGSFNIQMQKALPNACFIAMTGTPLMKKEKSTASKFGGIIDTYTVDKAVKDKAVVPILYEGRHAFQKVNENPIDTFFAMISEPLTDYQKADLKKKFSRADQLNIADQKIYSIAWDISIHFRDNWQNTPFKAQLVCQNKLSALKYKQYLDEIKIVSSEVVISAPDEREGEESAYGETPDVVKSFWMKMMDEHGNEKKYLKNVINRFKKLSQPEIIIVVDKLLTGFDVPVNTVLYVTRNLKEHTLLQAIARVNRVFPGKDYGYVIDYYGILGELDEALTTYSGLEDYDEEELSGTLTNVNEEIKKLPQRHSELWDIFKSLTNKKDVEAYENLLRDEAVRAKFYDKLTAYTKTLKVALSSLQFHKETEEKTLTRYKEDAAFFLKLRASVTQRYSDTVNYKQYESQIQNLIDKHIQTDKVEIITDLVNIFDKEQFAKEVEKVTGLAAKADRIASRTAKTITEKMDEDPAFYKKFSEMLKDTIRSYEQHRISESEYLQKVKDIMNSVLTHTDTEIPKALTGKDAAKAYFGFVMESLTDKIKDVTILKSIATDTALTIDNIINKSVLDNGKPIVDWQFKHNITGKLQIEIGDFLIDEVRDKHDIPLTFDEMDVIADGCIGVAKILLK
jgi:type I restriction enzyme, R subunit